MKITPIFGLVLAIHAVVIGLLIVQPGCQTNTAGEPTAKDTLPPTERNSTLGSEEPMTTTVRPARDPLSSASGLDDAFNAGFQVNEQPDTLAANQGSGDRTTPTRPNRMYTDSMPRQEPESFRNQETIPVISDEPRFDNYTVQPGDSLWKIAKDYDVDLAGILEANNLSKSSVIKVGQVILVPLEAPDLAPVPQGDQRLPGRSMDVETQTYTVQRGDTLSGIAKRFGTTIQDLKSLNNKSSDVIRIGETMMVPQGGVERTTPPLSSSSASTTPSRSGQEELEFTHTVRAGENPSMIASRYGMSTRELIRINGNFDPRKLRVGQVLKIKPAEGMEPDSAAGTQPTPSAGSSPSPSPQRDPNEPIRIRVSPPQTQSQTEPQPEPEPEIDPSILLEDVQEIPVLRVQPSE